MRASAVQDRAGNSSYDVAVVVPLHNRRSLIPFTLESLHPRFHPGVSLQVIVVDDGSTDGGADLVEQDFPSVELRRQDNLGAPTARNLGVEHAQAPAVQLLDSDDLVEPGYFLPRLEALAKHTKAAGAYGPWEVFSNQGSFSPSDIQARHSPYPISIRSEVDMHLRHLLRGWYLVSPTIVWRTDVIRQLGGQDSALHINQDVDFLFRALSSGYGLVGTNGPRSLIREHQGTRQGQVSSLERIEEMLELRRRFKRDLEQLGRLEETFRVALAEYSFDCWAQWRTVAPEAAAGFLALSSELWPGITVRGGWLFRAAGSVLGAPTATILKQRIQRFRRTVPL